MEKKRIAVTKILGATTRFLFSYLLSWLLGIVCVSILSMLLELIHNIRYVSQGLVIDEANDAIARLEFAFTYMFKYGRAFEYLYKISIFALFTAVLKYCMAYDMKAHAAITAALMVAYSWAVFVIIDATTETLYLIWLAVFITVGCLSGGAATYRLSHVSENLNMVMSMALFPFLVPDTFTNLDVYAHREDAAQLLIFIVGLSVAAIRGAACVVRDARRARQAADRAAGAALVVVVCSSFDFGRFCEGHYTTKLYELSRQAYHTAYDQIVHNRRPDTAFVSPALYRRLEGRLGPRQRVLWLCSFALDMETVTPFHRARVKRLLAEQARRHPVVVNVDLSAIMRKYFTAKLNLAEAALLYTETDEKEFFESVLPSLDTMHTLYDGIRDFKGRVDAIRARHRGQPDPFSIDATLNEIVSGIHDTVQSFYRLVKLMEFTVHCLCVLDTAEGRTREFYHDLPVGKCVDAIRRSHAHQAPLPKEVYKSARQLAKALNIRSVEKAAVGIFQLTAEVRNRLIGHGTLTYGISVNCLQPLSTLAAYVLEYSGIFTRAAELLAAPSLAAFVRVEDGHAYLLSNYGGEYAEYLDYHTGKVLTEGSKIIVFEREVPQI